MIQKLKILVIGLAMEKNIVLQRNIEKKNKILYGLMSKRFKMDVSSKTQLKFKEQFSKLLLKQYSE